MIGIVLVYNGYLAITAISTLLPAIPLPLGLVFNADWALGWQLLSRPVNVGLVVGCAIALAAFPKSLIRIGATVLSLSLGATLTKEWVRILPALNFEPFGQLDPVFNQDLSFYVFQLPLWELLEFWLSGLLLFLMAAVTLEYLLAGNTLSQGHFAGFSVAQQRHLNAIAASLFGVTALSHWLNRYELLYSPARCQLRR